MNKMYTFQFNFKDPDGNDDETQFCAENYDEACGLFESWYFENFRTNVPVSEYETSVVHNDDDEDEYGDRYGTPEEYYATKL